MSESSKVPRRRLLGLGTALGTALLGGGSLAMALRSFWPRSVEDAGALVRSCRAADLLPGQADASQLTTHGFWVVRQAHDGAYVALSARCPHMGCRLRRDQSSGRFRCACHASHFAPDGAVLRGPARRSMERLHISLSADGWLLVDRTRRIKEERGQRRQPGAQVEAPASAPDREGGSS